MKIQFNDKNKTLIIVLIGELLAAVLIAGIILCGHFFPTGVGARFGLLLEIIAALIALIAYPSLLLNLVLWRSDKKPLTPKGWKAIYRGAGAVFFIMLAAIMTNYVFLAGANPFANVAANVAFIVFDGLVFLGVALNPMIIFLLKHITALYIERNHTQED